MQTMRRIGVQINGKLVGSCDSISKVSSPLFKDILDPWFDIEGFVPAKPPLNENQLNVLEWLKWSVEEQGNSPMDAVYLLVLGESLDSVSLAYIALTPDQQTQVLAVLSKEVAE